MICVACGAIEGAGKDVEQPCSECGEPLRRVTRANIRLATEAVALERVRELVAEWTDEGLIERSSALRIHDRISRAHERLTTPEPSAPIAVPIPPPLPSPAKPVEPPPAAEIEFGTHDGPALGGLAVLTAIDAPEHVPGTWEKEVRPLLYENVGWFIGTLLVLAGSIYGVREAWRTLGGIARHVTVGGALFAYHALFVGLSAVLAKKSATTGKVLASISLGLLPIVFVALSSALQVSVAVGATIGIAFSLAAVFTTLSAARRLELPPLPVASLFVPSLLAELPLAVTAPDAWGRVALPFVGVVTVALAGRSRSLGSELVVGYSALALGVYALVGGPDDAARGAVADAGFGLWAAALACAVVASAERTRGQHPRATSVLSVTALGCLLVIVLRIAPAIFLRAESDVLAARALTVLVIVIAFAFFARRHPAALHVSAILAPFAGLLFTRAAFPMQPAAWPLGFAVACGLMMIGGAILGDRIRKILVGWSVPFALVALVYAPVVDAGAYRWTLLTALTLAASAHGVASVRHRGLHYLGGLSLVVAAVAYVLPGAPDKQLVLERIFVAIAALFALGAAAFDARAAALTDSSDKRARPFDDGSSAMLWCALAVATVRLRAPRQLDLSAVLPALRAQPVIAIVAAAFVLRGVRDRSALGSLIAATIGFATVVGLGGVTTAAQTAYVAGGAAFALAILANVRGTAKPAGAVVEDGQRHIFGVMPLPFAARGSRAIGDGFALGAWGATLVTVIATFIWMANRTEPERPLVVLGGAMIIGAHLVGFALPAFNRFALRGSVTALSMSAVLIGLTAVANRIGRPLPAPVVGLRISLIAIAVWGAARLAQWKGEHLGAALGDPRSGRRYHVVVHTGVVVLALLLVVDAFIIAHGSITLGLTGVPPTMLFGAAAATALLAWSLGAPWLLHIALPIALCGAALLTTQQSFLGTANPIALQTPVAWGRALLGPASAALLLALAAAYLRARALAVWTTVVACVIVAAGFYRAELIPSGLLVMSGVTLIVSGQRKLARAVLGLSAMSLVHALAQGAPRIPSWAGPIIALIACGALLGDEEDDSRSALDLLAALGFTVALVYALAAGATPDPITAGLGVVLGAVNSRWELSDALAPTAAICGAALAITGARANGRARGVLSQLLGATVLIVAAVAGTFSGDRALHGFPSTYDGTWLARSQAPTIAFVVAVLAALHHVIALYQPRARAARDLLLLATAVAGTAFVLAGQAPNAPSPGRNALLLGAGAIAIAAGTAAHVAFRERSSRHVYFVQLAVVATYGLFRSELLPNVPRETDAIFALCLGFVLLGVTVQARRARIPEIAASTRTFAALLPLFVALILPHRASMSAAVLAAFSGALYGALGWVERSRVLGSLGAAACNLALLFFAMSSGLTGREIQLASLGLFVLALGHVFASSIEHSARTAVRVTGGLFLYAPAAYRLATELGDAPSGAYAVGFGAACLVGILAGMVLHIRAYLAFGTGFLVLDVLANLTAAGIRDHRIGFLVLSLAGIGILGMMVFVTLKRDAVNAIAARLRLSLRAWD